MVDVIVTDARGLPEQAFLSMRIGEIRKQAPCTIGEPWHFPLGQQQTLLFDVFEKVGSTEVDLSSLSHGAVERSENICIQHQSGHTFHIALDLKHAECKANAQTMKMQRQQAALRAKNYLEDRSVQNLLQAMMAKLLENQPDDPLEFVYSYLLAQRANNGSKEPSDYGSDDNPGIHVEHTSAEAADACAMERQDSKVDEQRGDMDSKQLPESSTHEEVIVQGQSKPASAHEPYCNADFKSLFPEDDLPSVQPDLSGHHSICVEVLRQDPTIWHQYRNVKTIGGVSAALCIKPGMENVGHPCIQTMGLVAGDEDCYTLFNNLFDPAIEIRHNGYEPKSTHPTNLDYRMVSNAEADCSGLHLKSTRICVSRNIGGFLLPPAIDQISRHEVEQILVKCFGNLPDDMKGTYYPMPGSYSYPPRPGGMSSADEEELRELGVLFEEPTTPLMISSGYAREWPDARGVFLMHNRDCAIWVNFEDHCHLISLGEGVNIKAAFTRLCQIEQRIHAALNRDGLEWMYNEHLGFITSDPANLGTALCSSVDVRIPKLATHEDFGNICKALGVHVRCKAGTALDPTWEVSSTLRLGQSEVVIMDNIISSCKKLVEMELEMAAGHNVDIPTRHSFVADEGTVIQFQRLGLGDSEYPGFSIYCSDNMPNLNENHSCMALALKANPSIWTELWNKETAFGVTFGKCIKSGMDVPGISMIHAAGVVAGDEECFSVFSSLFDPVIRLLHNDFPPDACHQSNLNFLEVTDVPMDPSGKYAAGVQISCVRNIRGFRLPSAITIEERRNVEMLAVKAFIGIPESLQGSYYPLTGSFSYLPKPGGMSELEKEMLEQDGFLFKEPEETSLLSSGMGRHWPDARGVFVNRENSFVTWVNDEDHLRMTALHKSSDLKEAFGHLCVMESSIEKVIAGEGFTFMQNEHLGYISACPSKLGTGLSVSVMLKIPNLCANRRFNDICRTSKLTAKLPDATDEGLVEITMPSYLGTSEVELINCMIDGCKTLINIEQSLERSERLANTDLAMPVAF